jgi:hypothetical protein
VATASWRNRRGFLRGLGVLVLIALCLVVAYFLARGDAATMTAAFIRRVRMMGNPE